ncbi:MAG: hypothetical protein H3C62_00255 [Gemmatimonadaceae bacterium]|nr:hypothetical protein [Gemmatimonadaceae bacterium]
MSDQKSFFEKANGETASGAPRVRPADATADRGHGAPAEHVAREAVRQEAVRHGSADPDSVWLQRRLNRSPRAAEEHRAVGSGHAELFEFTPGSQMVAPKAVDPYKAFALAWDRARDAALSGYGGPSEHRIRFFLQARSVAHTREADGTSVVTVDLVGMRFRASGATLLDALDTLARRATRGRDGAEGPAPTTPVALSALEQANARRSPAERFEREMYSYFLSRKLTFTKSRDRLLPFTVHDEDVRRAGLLGVAAPERRGDEACIVGFFQALDRRLEGAASDAWLGVSRDAVGAEATERISAHVQSIEQRRTDRYLDDGIAAPSSGV